MGVCVGEEVTAVTGAFPDSMGVCGDGRDGEVVNNGDLRSGLLPFEGSC